MMHRVGDAAPAMLQSFYRIGVVYYGHRAYTLAQLGGREFWREFWSERRNQFLYHSLEISSPSGICLLRCNAQTIERVFSTLHGIPNWALSESETIGAKCRGKHGAQKVIAAVFA